MTIDLTGRMDFIESWLEEMPNGLGSFETWDQLNYNIKDRIANGGKVIQVTNDLFKIEGQQVMYYWYGNFKNIVLGTELYVKPQTLIVTVTGKNSKFRGKPPFASDLYNEILNDNHKTIRLMSDSFLSDEGFALWKRMLKLGHKVSLYDKEFPGKTFKTFNNPKEMDNYFANDDTNYSRYQYVLSAAGEVIAETKSIFNTRRYRELTGLL